MPEGDSVYQLSKRLQFMTGREVTASSLRVPRFATVDFTGMTVERVWPYGKHLFMQFGAAGHDAQILHTHLKMEGTWAFHRAGQRWRKPGHAARVVLSLADAPAPDIELVGFWLGLVRVFPAREYGEQMGYLGPDLLAEHFDAAEAVRRIEARPDMEIGRALLDQRNLAGIGNVYRVETLFMTRTNPWARVDSLPEGKLREIVTLAHKLLHLNKDRSMRSTVGQAPQGRPLFWAYGKDGQPCRRCGTQLKRGEIDDALLTVDPAPSRTAVQHLRKIVWCPRCQSE